MGNQAYSEILKGWNQRARWENNPHAAAATELFHDFVWQELDISRNAQYPITKLLRRTKDIATGLSRFIEKNEAGKMASLLPALIENLGKCCQKSYEDDSAYTAHEIIYAINHVLTAHVAAAAEPEFALDHFALALRANNIDTETHQNRMGANGGNFNRTPESPHRLAEGAQFIADDEWKEGEKSLASITYRTALVNALAEHITSKTSNNDPNIFLAGNIDINRPITEIFTALLDAAKKPKEIDGDAFFKALSQAARLHVYTYDTPPETTKIISDAFCAQLKEQAQAQQRTR